MKRPGQALIVGGGKIGYFLARDLLRAGYRVQLIERDPERAAELAERLEVVCHCGDGAQPSCLEAAGARHADYLIAVTDRDEDNLVACQVGKRAFGAGTTVALVSDPRNEALFERLGVDRTIGVTGSAVRLVANLLPINGMRLLQAIGQSDAEIAEFALTGASAAAGASVAALRLPPECVLIALLRDGEVLYPRGGTELRAGDRVFGLAKAAELPALETALLGRAGHAS
jgi:trk system potassium uptake protein TrkA